MTIYDDYLIMETHNRTYNYSISDHQQQYNNWFRRSSRPRAQIQQSKITVAQLSTDYRGDDFTASLTLANPNVLNESGVAVGHYLQAVTRNLALGAELAYQYGPEVPGGEVAVASAAARWVTMGRWVSADRIRDSERIDCRFASPHIFIEDIVTYQTKPLR